MKYHGRALGKALIEEGILTDDCVNAELHIPLNGAVFIRYEVYVTDTDIPKIQRALGRMLESKTGSEGPAT